MASWDYVSGFEVNQLTPNLFVAIDSESGFLYLRAMIQNLWLPYHSVNKRSKGLD